MPPPRRRAALLSVFLALAAASSLRAQERLQVGADASGAPAGASAAGAAARFGPPVGLAAGLSPEPTLAAPPSFAAALSPLAAARTAPVAASFSASPRAAAPPSASEPHLFPAAKDSGSVLPRSALINPSAVAETKAPGRNTAPGSDDASRFDGDALFDGRRLQEDDRIGLILSGYRFDEATGRILAPKTGEPVTNAQARSLQALLRDSRSRNALLRLSRETAPGGSAERKTALSVLNRDTLPREVLKAAKTGPEKERATILRRLTSLYRRWLERAPAAGALTVTPANAEAEEKLGALISAAIVKRLSDDPEGVRLLDQLRDEHGALRLPTMRVLRLDARYGALYSPYGRQLILSLAYLKPLLLARLPEAERAEAEKSLATEGEALQYLSRNPARVAALTEAIDVAVFHELVHFRQDLSRPLMTAQGKEEAVGFNTYEREYEAFFRHVLYVHSLLSRPNADLGIDRLSDYLTFIDNFDTWKGNIERNYAANLLNSTVATEELVRLQDDSQRLIQRLAGPEGPKSETAATEKKAAELAENRRRRLEGAARGTTAVAVEKKAAEAELAEYRRLWPQLARDGLRRWAELNESLGRWPQVALAQERLARLAGSPADAAALNEKASQSIEKSLARLANPEGLGLDERIEWSNALAAYFNGRGEPWRKELWIASFRDSADKARELREEAARTSDESARRGLIARAEQFESTLRRNRVVLHNRAETDLASAFSEADPRRRAAALAQGYMEAEVLGDAELIAAFKPLAEDSSEAGWTLEAPRAANTALVRLEAGAGLGLDERIAWLNSLAAYSNARGMPWQKPLWIAVFRDYPQKARELNAEGERTPEGPAKSELSRRAQEFEGVVGKQRATLRANAEANLASARAEADQARRANFIEWGSMQAGVLGDETLSAAFRSLGAVQASN